MVIMVNTFHGVEHVLGKKQHAIYSHFSVGRMEVLDQF